MRIAIGRLSSDLLVFYHLGKTDDLILPETLGLKQGMIGVSGYAAADGDKRLKNTCLQKLDDYLVVINHEDG